MVSTMQAKKPWNRNPRAQLRSSSPRETTKGEIAHHDESAKDEAREEAKACDEMNQKNRSRNEERVKNESNDGADDVIARAVRVHGSTIT